MLCHCYEQYPSTCYVHVLYFHQDCNAMPIYPSTCYVHVLLSFFLLHFVCNAMPMLRAISIHLLCPCIQSRKAFGHSFPHFLIYFNKNQQCVVLFLDGKKHIFSTKYRYNRRLHGVNKQTQRTNIYIYTNNITIIIYPPKINKHISCRNQIVLY